MRAIVEIYFFIDSILEKNQKIMRKVQTDNKTGELHEDGTQSSGIIPYTVHPILSCLAHACTVPVRYTLPNKPYADYRVRRTTFTGAPRYAYFTFNPRPF